MGSCSSKRRDTCQTEISLSTEPETFRKPKHLRIDTSGGGDFVPDDVQDLDHENSVCASPALSSPGRLHFWRNMRETETIESIFKQQLSTMEVLARLLEMFSASNEEIDLDDDATEELETIRSQYLRFIETEQMQSRYKDLYFKLSADLSGKTITAISAQPIANQHPAVRQLVDTAALHTFAPVAMEELNNLLCELSEMCAGCVAVPACTKQIEIAQAKADSKYGGDLTRVLDVVRGSIICDSIETIQQVVQHLRAKRSDVQLVRWKSSLTGEHEPTGEYRDVKVTCS